MSKDKKPSNAIYALIAIFAGVLLVGNIFKILHWPYRAIITLLSSISLGSIIILVIIKFYHKSKKRYFDYLGLLLVLLILSIQFNKWLWFTEMYILVGLQLFIALIWLVIALVSVLMRKSMILPILNINLVVGLGCLVTESIMRSMQLPGGTLVSVAGILFIIIGLLSNTSIHETERIIRK